MSITDYSSLQQAVIDWANTPEVEQAAPTFIQMAEAKFNRDLRVRDMLTRATITSNVEFLALPTDWLQTYSLEMPDSAALGIPELTYVGLNEAKEYKALGITGNTRYYTQINRSLEMLPAPGGNVDLALTYYAAIPALATENTNWLLTKAPDLYLYSALLEAAPYLKNDQRIPIWAQAAAQSMESVRMDSERAMRPGTRVASARRTFG